MFFQSLVSQDSGIEECLFSFFKYYLSDQKPIQGKIEIEAKIGQFVDNAGIRISLPISTETILGAGNWYRFESTIPEKLHRHLNNILNAQVSKGILTYKHTKTTDYMFQGSSDKTKARTTKDERGNVLESIEKRRIADIAIFFPNALFDVRISINEEIPVSEPGGRPQTERYKDRISYTEGKHGHQLDLTQVRQGGEYRYELEIEALNPNMLMESEYATREFYASIWNIIKATTI